MTRLIATLPQATLTWEFASATAAGGYGDKSDVLLKIKDLLKGFTNPWTVVHSFDGADNAAADLLIGATDVADLAWILMQQPTGAQVVFWHNPHTGLRTAEAVWSPSGGFVINGNTRPVASDSVAVEMNAQWGYCLSSTYHINIWHTVEGGNTRIAFSTTYAGLTAIEGWLAVEDVVTDLTVAQWELPKVVVGLCTYFALGYNGPCYGYLNRPESNPPYPGYNIMSINGSLQHFGLPAWTTANVYNNPVVMPAAGAIDGLYRLSPVYVVKMEATPFPQMFGYIPDMWWGQPLTVLTQPLKNAFPSTGPRKLTQVCDLVLPYAGATAIDFGIVADEARYDGSIILAGFSRYPAASDDVVPPIFAGITSATMLSSSEAIIEWTEGFDEVSAQEDLLYHVHYSVTPEATFQTRIVSAPGATSLVIGGLSSNTRYYVKVRCADERTNVDDNEVELSCTTDVAIVFDEIPPIISLISPTLGVDITRTTPVVVEVTDDIGLEIVPIFCNYPVPYAELSTYVYDGEKLHPLFFESTIETISGGFRYTIIPHEGWVTDPTIALDPVDTSGNPAGGSGAPGACTWGDGRLWGESGLYWE
jgi:hypothetical protein